MRDIEKALTKLVQKKEPTDPRTKLPSFYYDKIDIKLFSPKIVSQGGLPPFRPGVNHAIELEKD